MSVVQPRPAFPGLDEATRNLVRWIGDVVPGLACSVQLELPAAGTAPPGGTSLILLRLTPGSPPRHAAAPLELRADYLLTVGAADPLAAHRTLGEIAFAAMARTDCTVSASDTGGATLILSVRVLRERVVQRAAPVREPMRIKLDQAKPMRGVLIGANAAPLAHVPVAIRGAGSSTSTDSAGTFKLALPGERAAAIEAEIAGARHPVAAEPDSNIFTVKSEG